MEVAGTSGTAPTSTSASDANNPAPPREGSSSAWPPVPRLPWSECIMGCRLMMGAEVILLQCFHVVCSKRCASMIPRGSAGTDAASATLLKCPKCFAKVEKAHLSREVVLEKEFIPKGVPKGVCNNCIFDRVAIAYCPECPNYLCQECADIHPQLRVSRHHVLNYNLIDEASKKPDGSPSPSQACKGHPEEELSYACMTCKVKICGMGLEAHGQGHEVVHIRKEKRKLEEQIETARQMVEVVVKAKTELKTKRSDLTTFEWPELREAVNSQIREMMNVLHYRLHEVIREVNQTLNAKARSLTVKEGSAEVVRISAGQFVKTGEIVLKEMDDMAAVNFLRHGKIYLQWLSDMEAGMVQDFDNFIEKDFHFTLDSATNKQALEYLKKCCRVKYKYKPSAPPAAVTGAVLEE